MSSLDSIYQVNAFATPPYLGNPAAVCVLTEDRTDEWMQNLATQIGLSETAFLRPLDNNHFHLRWFTPAYEVDLCGHATMASAHVLWEQNLAASEVIRFESRSGTLEAAPVDSRVQLNFPVTPVTEEEPASGLVDCFTTEGTVIPVLFSGRSAFDLFLQYESEQIVRDMQVDFDRLNEFDVRGVIVTAQGSDEFDVVSRFFAPGAGVEEDPVTGSAHCSLIDFWSQRLGTDQLTGFQASERGGIVHMTRQGDRVLLGGDAVTDRVLFESWRDLPV